MTQQPIRPSDLAEANQREQTIRWLMSEEGTRWNGERIPRWKAEQMVAAPGSYESTKETVEQELERQRQLSKKFHGVGSVGQAFKILCKAGCETDWLETGLLSLPHYPLTRRRAVYTAEDKRRLGRIIAKLDYVARELPRFCYMMMLSTVKDWPAPPQELPIFLGGIAYCLRESMTAPKWTRLIEMTASSRIPYLVEQVKRCTGRPHYSQVATLIGAAYGLHDYGETDLKMFVSRSRRRRGPK